MGALAADFPWTSEDDFKLKSAALIGVPLESLATGDVQFSKKFTTQELHDRWYAILYDPIVSQEASARMMEFEFFALSQISNSDNSDAIDEHIPLPTKRKPKSIRKHYYETRKKMKEHPLDPPNLTFPNPTEEHTLHLEHTLKVSGHDDMNLDVNYETIQNEDQNGIMEDNYIDESDEFKEIYDLLEDEGPELPPIDQTLTLDSSTFDIKEEQQSMEPTSDFPIKMERGMCDESNANSYLEEISNTLFGTEDEMPFLYEDENVIGKSYIDGLESLLLDSPNKDYKNDTVISTLPVLDECRNEESKSLEGNMGITLPSTSTSFKPTSIVICTLNMEDPDIPSNDDVFLLPLGPFPSSYQMTDLPPPRPSPHKASIKDSGVGWKRDFRIPKPIPSKDIKPIILDNGNNQDFSNNGQYEGQNGLFREVEKVNMESGEMNYGFDGFVNCGKMNGGFGNGEDNSLAIIQEEEKLNGIIPIDVNDSILALQQFSMDDDTSSQSDDDDIPSFSDVEEMILDEKLSEDEKKLYLSGDWSSQHLQSFSALKYMHPDIQRGFIRWEQSVNNFVKKEMTSWGAFAVLQGWKIKYYIKKPEILMGRATEDVFVDVDLGREGCNCRISRRQAIIQMDREGLFHIKNLSKYSIFVNSDELSTNKTTILTSSCLIEIRGMPFLFETNEECIKQYVCSMLIKSDVDD